jgi:hypothetical protein
MAIIVRMRPGGTTTRRSTEHAVFADAVANQDSRMAQVYFDASGVAGLGQWVDKTSLIATRIRQLGVNPAPREAWAAFRR